MEKKEKGTSSVYLIVASIGMVLLGFGLLEYLLLVGNPGTPNFLLTFASFFILVHYIYHLEKKTGVSSRVIWIKSLLVVLSLFILISIFH